MTYLKISPTTMRCLSDGGYPEVEVKNPSMIVRNLGEPWGGHSIEWLLEYALEFLDKRYFSNGS